MALAESELSVVVRRRYRASREAVFRAFTDPDVLARWFGPSADYRTEVLQLEARAGGRYRIRFHFPEGGFTVVAGSFREVSAPERLVYTWGWEEPDPDAGKETLVTVALAETGDATEVTVTHERFADAEARERHDAGWNGALDRLEDELRKGEPR